MTMTITEDVATPTVKAPERPRTIRQRLEGLRAWAQQEDAARRAGQPSAWDQEHWISYVEGAFVEGNCGTACCIAGKVALEDGGKPVSDYAEGSYDDVTFPGFGRRVSVEWYARNALGLDWEQMDWLFAGGNTLVDVEDAIDRILDDLGDDADRVITREDVLADL